MATTILLQHKSIQSIMIWKRYYITNKIISTKHWTKHHTVTITSNPMATNSIKSSITAQYMHHININKLTHWQSSSQLLSFDLWPCGCNYHRLVGALGHQSISPHNMCIIIQHEYIWALTIIESIAIIWLVALWLQLSSFGWSFRLWVCSFKCQLRTQNFMPNWQMTRALDFSDIVIAFKESFPVASR